MDNQTHCEQDIECDRGAFCFGPNDVCLFLSSSGALYLCVSREINEKKLQATREANIAHLLTPKIIRRGSCERGTMTMMMPIC